MSDRTFDAVGISTHPNDSQGRKSRLANGAKGRVNVLLANGHTQVAMLTMDKPRTRVEAIAWLAQNGASIMSDNENVVFSKDIKPEDGAKPKRVFSEADINVFKRDSEVKAPVAAKPKDSAAKASAVAKGKAVVKNASKQMPVAATA